MDRLESGDDYTDIPGVVYQRDGQTIVSEGRFTSDFHRAPRLDLLDMRRYNGSGFGVGVVTKLAQAYYPTSDDGFDGTDWRIRNPDEVVDEIKSLNSDFGINKVFFIDSGFNIPVDHAKKLCRAIIDSGIKIRWNSYVRPGHGDEELVHLMKKSGCSLALLAESGRGGGDLGDRLDGLGVMGHLCQEAGLPLALNISFGEPGENAETVDQKLSLLRQVEPAFAVPAARFKGAPQHARREDGGRRGYDRIRVRPDPANLLHRRGRSRLAARQAEIRGCGQAEVESVINERGEYL